MRVAFDQRSLFSPRKRWCQSGETPSISSQAEDTGPELHHSSRDKTHVPFEFKREIDTTRKTTHSAHTSCVALQTALGSDGRTKLTTPSVREERTRRNAHLKIAVNEDCDHLGVDSRRRQQRPQHSVGQRSFTSGHSKNTWLANLTTFLFLLEIMKSHKEPNK